MEEINEELENKEVERVKMVITDNEDNTELPNELPNEIIKEKPKTKKVRSEKQIAAFEKAKLKRAENVSKRAQEKETLKKEKKLNKTKITETESIIDSLPIESIKELKKSAVDPAYKPVLDYDVPPQHSKGHYNHQPQPSIINNYYYGTNDHTPLPERKKKKKVVIESSSSEEEEEYTEEEIYGEIQPSSPTLKYKFV